MDKIIQVNCASMPPYEEYCEEIRELWASHWITHTGIKHQQLEKELKNHLEVPCVQLFSNGHLALELALKILGLKGEVITTPFTFASTTQAIIRNGLKPVFCDIKEDNYTIDAEKIEALVTDKTCAIVPVHVYGNVCDYKRIDEIAKKYNLKVIYDAAHAFGEKIDGVNCSTLGDISMYSFHATKVFNTIEGGCLTFCDKSLEKECRAIRQFGMYGKEDAEIVGTNAKMTEFSAAMGLCNLRHIGEYISARRLCAEEYRKRLSKVEGIKLCPVQANVESNYAYLPVLFDKAKFGADRNEVTDKLADKNIYVRKYFYPITSEFTIVQNMFEVNPTPIAKQISDNILTLPLHSELTVADIDRICDVILA